MLGDMNLKKLIASFCLALLISVVYFSVFNPYQTNFIIYPNTQLDSLKFSAVINSDLFQKGFDESLKRSALELGRYNFKASTKKDELITVVIESSEQKNLSLISTHLQKYIAEYFTTHDLKSSNSEIKIFIINDIVTLLSKGMQKYSTDEKSYLDELGVDGQLIKNLLRTQAALYIDSRLNNIDITDMNKKIDDMKLEIAGYIGFSYHLKNLNSEGNVLNSAGQLKPASTRTFFDQPKMTTSAEYYLKKTIVEIAQNKTKDSVIEEKVSFKFLKNTENKKKYSLQAMAISVLTLFAVILCVFFLTGVLKRETR